VQTEQHTLVVGPDELLGHLMVPTHAQGVPGLGQVETASPIAYVDRHYREALAEVPRLPGEAPSDARRRELFYLNITRFLPMLLNRKDRMSMACGFDMRARPKSMRARRAANAWDRRIILGDPRGVTGNKDWDASTGNTGCTARPRCSPQCRSSSGEPSPDSGSRCQGDRCRSSRC
jgi:Asparagine synthase